MDSMMDLDRIKALIDLLAQSPLVELELIEGEDRVRLVRTAGGSAVPGREFSAPSPTPEPQPVLVSAAPVASGAGHESSLVCAPMFGVVHLTPAPGEAPFVQVGDTVTEGQVLCTIEAMKMFNAIESELSGAVLEILVAPGSEVESGQPLFRIG
jgi:acetyl-CoA carboxylase biotin carboxyl carrier protein